MRESRSEYRANLEGFRIARRAPLHERSAAFETVTRWIGAAFVGGVGLFFLFSPFFLGV